MQHFHNRKKDTPAASKISLIIGSNLRDVRLVEESVRELCREELGLNKIDAYRVSLCLQEGINNAIIHAYGDGSGGEVLVEVTFSADAIEVRVFDSDKCIPDIEIKDDSMKESGRGFEIIRKIMDHVFFEQTDGGKVLVMSKSFS